jgi:acyl-CoA hydrolase
MSVQHSYAQKRVTASEAVRLVRDGDLIIVPTGVGEPPALLGALSEQRRRFHDVKVHKYWPCANMAISTRKL